ncbi:Os09g0271000 [Oryza sativa Japonica Group]|uniref:Os09g0271000 protein n=2 Tax=Oryza sativa subsp. japonica TaxID=39947 RepID=Q0J316_ORYSJ|nr:Os09g0271000 [Oryza sativa Japonica Group]BAG95800.1 unnamed protein product [Oryza sativa Japonica Group]BAT07168.1 Os09g0271000 [Oryza sativa Japonica Group]|eukprot:NP_001062735.2 Os09g0271000 [Oryza sativa Japonica Group]
MEMTRTTRIVSIFVSLVLLEQGDIYGYKYKAPRGRDNNTDHRRTTYKPTHAKTSCRMSTSDISIDKPNMVSTEANKRDLALSLISPSADSRRKTTLSSTTCWLSMPPSRRWLDMLSQLL